ncbi:hypothetical protein D3C84_839400 [compost metagenome]
MHQIDAAELMHDQIEQLMAQLLVLLYIRIEQRSEDRLEPIVGIDLDDRFGPRRIEMLQAQLHIRRIRTGRDESNVTLVKPGLNRTDQQVPYVVQAHTPSHSYSGKYIWISETIKLMRS